MGSAGCLPLSLQTLTVTRRNVAGITVPPFRLLFWRFRQLQKLAVEFLHFPVLSGGFVSVHGRPVKSSKRLDHLFWVFVRRDEVERILGQGNLLFRHTGLPKSFDNVAFHSPRHWANKHLRRRR